ncbi:MAG: cation transporter [Geminicoccaceae bacterium]|nr:cation transporter [Geminicoccaceae bacterium]
MSARCCDDHCKAPAQDARYRGVLWVALGINAAMFLAELVAGLAAGSASLQADALDFLADAANYGISLSVLGLALAWRARAALAKGVSMGVLGLWVAGSTIWHAFMATVPEAHVMGIVGVLALLANVVSALLLYRYRAGDANMRSVWICSRNDAIGNVAVLLAALGVFGTGTGWPDIVVAAVMATLALWGAAQVVRQARGELRVRPDAAVPVAGTKTSVSEGTSGHPLPS